MVFSLGLAILFAPLLASASLIMPREHTGKKHTGKKHTPDHDCIGTISSITDVAAAVKCTTVNINAFTVPAGQTFKLNLRNATTVNLNGDITFGNKNWAGPLFQIHGNSITFKGNGHQFDGGGPFYWDGQGSNGGSTKPRPMMKIEMSGTFSDTKVINSPAHTFSIHNKETLVVDGITIDNSAGDAPNSKSGGKPAAHNTDGFDVSAIDATIQNSSIRNQDDCIAINKGSHITFKNNKCSGGHGISIGSIKGGVTVSGVVISGNTISDSDQALRIKTDGKKTDSTVEDVTYSDNTGTGLRKFGVLIDQSYPATLGSPGNGIKITGVKFTGGTNDLSVASSAVPVAINCGTGTCSDFDWTSLKTSGGKTNFMHNAPSVPSSSNT
jgi:galacturan 1,4-alpha-galacturonidase